MSTINRLLVGLLIVVLLAACQPLATPEAPKEAGVYYFLAANNSDPFYVPGVKGFMDAAEELGVEAQFVGPMDLSLAAQLKTFEELVANPSTKGIFWYPMDFNAGEPYVQAAVDKGIAMVIGAADSPFKTRHAFIGYDNTVLGQQAGAWVAKLTECKGSVGVVSVIGPNLEERKAGFYAYLEEVCPDLELVDPATHDGSAANATQVLESYMVANPDLTLLWFCDGGSGQQVQVWKDLQTAGTKTMFLAMDMPPATLQAVKDGVFKGTVAQDTYTEERIGMQMLYDVAHGKPVPNTTFLNAILIDQSNVDQYLEK
jgi:ABC-type sugar transport system substrate-binding protein